MRLLFIENRWNFETTWRFRILISCWIKSLLLCFKFWNLEIIVLAKHCRVLEITCDSGDYTVYKSYISWNHIMNLWTSYILFWKWFCYEKGVNKIVNLCSGVVMVNYSRDWMPSFWLGVNKVALVVLESLLVDSSLRDLQHYIYSPGF